MPIKTEHYAELYKAIRRVLSLWPEFTLQSYLDRDLTAERFRWDLMFVARRRGYFKIEGYDDSDIDTALKRITRTT